MYTIVANMQHRVKNNSSSNTGKLLLEGLNNGAIKYNHF